MAGNRKFHNKFHSANHHTLPSPHIRDSGLDPVASHEFPFIGDFVMNGLLSASNNYMLNDRYMTDTLDTVPHGQPVPAGWNVLRDSTYVDGDVTITGNLSALGKMTYLETQVHASSATEIMVYADNSNGKNAALVVDQHGTNDILHLKNDGKSALFVTGSFREVNGSLTGEHGGHVGVNLGNLQGVDDPVQRMTIVGSVSVVGDPLEQANQFPAHQADPGVTGSIYIEGGLHVNDHAYLDQLTVDTTDGNFLVSGGNNDATANKFRVEVPTHLDKTLIDTSDGDFVVSGSNKIFIDTKDENGVGLDMTTHAQFDQLTIDTTSGDFNVTGDGAMGLAPTGGITFNSATSFTKMTVDTSKSRVWIRDITKSSTNEEPTLTTGHLPTDLHGNLPTGALSGVVSIDCHTLLDQTTINTFDGPVTIYSNAAIVHDEKSPVDIRVPTKLQKTTIDTSQTNGEFTVLGDNRMLVTASEGTGDDQKIGLEVQTHTLLNRTTFDTRTGDVLIKSTTGGAYDNYKIFRVETPSQLEKTRFDLQHGGILIDATTDRGHIMDVRTPVEFSNDVDFELGSGNSTVSLTGVGGTVLFDTTNIYFDSRVDFRQTDVQYTLGDGDIVAFRGVNEIGNADVGLVQSFVPVDTLNTTLSASNVVMQPGDGEGVVIRGGGTLDVSIDSVFKEKTFTVSSAPTFDLLIGDMTITDSTTNDFTSRKDLIINVPTTIQGLTAESTEAPIDVRGDGDFNIYSKSYFSNLATFNNELRSNNLLNSLGITRLSETIITLDQGEQFTIQNADNETAIGSAVIGVETEFVDNVVFRKDITVDGNVYLHADSAGVIHLGDAGTDTVEFKADVDSDVLPDVEVETTTSEHSLGSSISRWKGIHVESSYMDRIETLEALINSQLTVNGNILFDVDTNDFVIRGDGYTKMQNDTIMTGTFSAADGPWYFVGEDVEQGPAVQSFDSNGGSTWVLPPPNPPAFNVETRSMFHQSLTALGPVQIGDLPDGVLEELGQPTLNIYGTTVVRDGNLKIQSDIRHLDNDSTLIRFTNDRLVMNVGDEAAFELKHQVQTGDQIATIGNENINSLLNINSNVGIHGDNQITAVLGDGVDLHGSMRVTETLSAKHLHVDTITVHDYSFGNIGGGLGGSGLFTPLSGVAAAGQSTTHQAGDSSAEAYTGVDTGIEFDALTDRAADIQKTYTFSFKATNTDTNLGVVAGDTQSLTYQFAYSWDTTNTRAIVNDVEFGIITTADNPFATVTAIVLKNRDLPVDDRLVKIIVVPQVDCEFYIHNVMVQDRPQRIDAFSMADLDVAGTLTIHGDQEFAADVKLIDGAGLDVSGDARIRGDLTVDGNLYLSAGADGTINIGNSDQDNLVLTAEISGDMIPESDITYDLGSTNNQWNHIYGGALTISTETNIGGDVHIKGDLRVDGNTYLSAAGGIINVGDAADDVVIFNADVSSHIIPDKHAKYNLGSETQWWNTTFTDVVSSNTIYTDETYTQGLTAEQHTELQTLDVLGKSNLIGDVDVTGKIYATDIVVSGEINIGVSNIERGLSISEDLKVGGGATISNNLVVESDTQILSSLTIDEDLTLHGDLQADGTLTVSSSASVDGDISVSGGVIADDDIITTGDIAAQNLNLTGTIDSGDFTTTGNISAAGDLTVIGDTVVSVLTASDTQIEGQLTVDSSVDVGGKLTTAGDLDTQDIVAKSLTLTSDINTDNITVENDVHIKGNLRVDGNAYLSAGVDGKINVGDSRDDTLVFNADISGSLLPDFTNMYDLGDVNNIWNELFVNDINTTNIVSTSITATDIETDTLTWKSGYNTTDLDSLLQYFDSSKGAYGFAHLVTGHRSTDMSAPVVDPNELPDQAISIVHTTSNPSDVQNTNIKNKVYRGHIVHVTGTTGNPLDHTLIATVDNPSGVYNTLTGDYSDYLKLSIPNSVVRKINDQSGPNVYLTSDDIVDTNDTNKWVNQTQIDKFTKAADDLDSNTPRWDDTSSVVESTSSTWNETRDIVDNNLDVWSNSTNTMTVVMDNSGSWNKNIQDTAYALSVKTNTLTRGSLYVATSGDSPEFLAMQTGNIAGDANWNELTYDNAMVLPLDTYVREVIVRGTNTANATVKIGIHTNQHATPGGKEHVYFELEPIEQKTQTFTYDHQPRVFSFSSYASASRLSTLGVSISANQPLEETSVTVVYDYVDGDVLPHYRPKETTFEDMGLSDNPDLERLAPGSTRTDPQGLVLGTETTDVGEQVISDFFVLLATDATSQADEQDTYNFLKSYKTASEPVTTTQDEELNTYAQLIPVEFSRDGTFTDSRVTYIWGHLDPEVVVPELGDGLLMFTRVADDLGTSGNRLNYINGVSRVKFYDPRPIIYLPADEHVFTNSEIVPMFDAAQDEVGYGTYDDQLMFQAMFDKIDLENTFLAVDRDNTHEGNTVPTDQQSYQVIRLGRGYLTSGNDHSMYPHSYHLGSDSKEPDEGEAGYTSYHFSADGGIDSYQWPHIYAHNAGTSGNPYAVHPTMTDSESDWYIQSPNTPNSYSAFSTAWGTMLKQVYTVPEFDNEYYASQMLAGGFKMTGAGSDRKDFNVDFCVMQKHLSGGKMIPFYYWLGELRTNDTSEWDRFHNNNDGSPPRSKLFDLRNYRSDNSRITGEYKVNESRVLHHGMSPKHHNLTDDPKRFITYERDQLPKLDLSPGAQFQVGMLTGWTQNATAMLITELQPQWEFLPYPGL